MKQLEAQHAYEQALDYSEQILATMKRQRVPHEEIVRFLVDTLHRTNQYANDLLKENQAETSVRLLLRAEKLLLQHEGSDLAGSLNLTYNNLACVYKHAGELELALNYLETAIRVANKYGDKSSLAMTFLNESAILSELGEHVRALDCASKAAGQCQNDLIRVDLRSKSEPSNKKLVQERCEKWSLLSIAFYNIGIQTEFLEGKAAALKLYNKALSAIANSPNADPNLRKAFASARDKAAQQTEEPKKPASPRPKHDKIRVLAAPNRPKARPGKKPTNTQGSPMRAGTAKKARRSSCERGSPVLKMAWLAGRDARSPKSSLFARAFSSQGQSNDEKKETQLAGEIEELKKELRDELRRDPLEETGNAYERLTKVEELRGKLPRTRQEKKKAPAVEKDEVLSARANNKHVPVLEVPSLILGSNKSAQASLSVSNLGKEVNPFIDSDRADYNANENEIESFAAGEGSVKNSNNPFFDGVPDIHRGDNKKEGDGTAGVSNDGESMFTDNKTAGWLVGYHGASKRPDPVASAALLSVPTVTPSENDISSLTDLGQRKVPVQQSAGNILSSMNKAQQQMSAQTKRQVPRLDEAVIIGGPGDISGLSVTPRDVAVSSAKSSGRRPDLSATKAAEKIQRRFRGHVARRLFEIMRVGRVSNWRMVHRGLYRRQEKGPVVMAIHLNSVERLAKITLYDLATHRVVFKLCSEVDLSRSIGPGLIRKYWEDVVQNSSGSIEEDCGRFFKLAKQQRQEEEKQAQMQAQASGRNADELLLLKPQAAEEGGASPAAEGARASTACASLDLASTPSNKAVDESIVLRPLCDRERDNEEDSVVDSEQEESSGIMGMKHRERVEFKVRKLEKMRNRANVGDDTVSIHPLLYSEKSSDSAKDSLQDSEVFPLSSQI